MRAELVQLYQYYKQSIIKMFKSLTILLLILANIQLAQSQDYFLSPAYPPTGFYQQYYQVRFRVRGISFPTFTFTNLPSFLKGESTGVVSGTPDLTGTFRFTITYTDGTITNSQKVVISIANSPNTVASNAQAQLVVNLIIKAAADTWIYRSGDKISVQLNGTNGVAPITWNYKNLPAGLTGDSNGLISGSVTKDGSYSFSASCGDAKGKTAQSFYTLNVQPGTLIKTNNIISVPDRSVPVVYDLSQVESQQIAADIAVTSAAKVVSAAKDATQVSQVARAKSQLALNLANKQEHAAGNTVAAAQSLYDQSVDVAHVAQANLNTAKNIVVIAQTAYDNAVQNLKTAKENLVAAQAVFDAASAAFAAANAVFIKAQNELSQAQTDYTNALASFKDAQNANNIAWNNVQSAKAALDVANTKLQEVNQQVSNAKNNVGLATQSNDDAQTNLNVADAALNAAQHALEDANKEVAELRSQGNQGKTELGIANFNLNQALNNLYVAQAAKAASDKATAIAYAQGAASIDILKGESTYIFSGCNQKVYPTISGTVAVSTLIASGARLNSGHILTWGDCTDKTMTIAPSDVITFVGTIQNGVISASSIIRQ